MLGTRKDWAWVGIIAGAAIGVPVALATLPTTVRDFFFGGTQPNTLVEPVASALDCRGCHSDFNVDTEPFTAWSASMMGQAARDPVFHAALAIANQDAAFAGDLCLRCHTPGGWVMGRSEPPDGSALIDTDMEGVTCNFCHRMVDPVANPGNPLPDAGILAALQTPPTGAHSANFVLDPFDRRRGPFDLGPEFTFHEWLQSPLHTRSQMCATCHDVSNPAFTKQPDGTYALNALDTPHPDGDKTHMFPIERTFSEWSQSQYAAGPVNVNGRFGGNLPAVSTCQDCHMPTTTGKGCRYGEVRQYLPRHQFNGGNTWVLRAVRNLYPDNQTSLSEDSVADSISRAMDMLARASDTQLSTQTVGSQTFLKVRIINESGHKLPTGYAEGRRMWINVKFFDGNGELVRENGGYDFNAATLDEATTKVYEGKMGVDAAVSAATGVPVGPSHHFALNNKWYKDNRIPPRGFTNAGFASVQAAPVSYAYADGQNWDDTLFDVPAGAASARVVVYYQTTTREYIEFLRDKNTTNNAGQIAYDQWVLTGKSEPAVLDDVSIALPCYANCDDSQAAPVLNANDFVCFLNRYARRDPWANCDGSTQAPVFNIFDFQCFLGKFASGCP